MHPGQHLLRLERLGDIVVRPHFQAGYLVLQLPLRGEHDDGHLGGLPDLPAHGPAIHGGKHDVQHHQVGLDGVELLQPLQAVPGHMAGHALLLQVQPDQVGDILVVLNDENTAGH